MNDWERGVRLCESLEEWGRDRHAVDDIEVHVAGLCHLRLTMRARQDPLRSAVGIGRRRIPKLIDARVDHAERRGVPRVACCRK